MTLEASSLNEIQLSIHFHYVHASQNDHLILIKLHLSSLRKLVDIFHVRMYPVTTMMQLRLSKFVQRETRSLKEYAQAKSTELNKPTLENQFFYPLTIQPSPI